MISGPRTRREFLRVAAGAAVGAALPSEAMPAAGPDGAFTVDLKRVVARTTPQAIGLCCTTYGRTPLTHEEQAEAEARLDCRYVRLPVGVREGRVTSSARGASRDLNVSKLAKWYQQRGARLTVTLGGRTEDGDSEPGDAERVARELAAAGVDLGGVEFAGPNEPDHQGWSMEQTLAVGRRCCDEIRRVRPGQPLWGPTWSRYKREALQQWAAGMGERCGGIAYHHYAMGTTSLPTAQALAQTPRWGREIGEIRADLRSMKLPERVSVTELNFSWRLQDGTPPDGRNHRFFSAVNTVWAASVLGHILTAGGSGAIYGNQNGALGVFVEAGPHDQGRPPSSPMPIYWGLAVWTGARLFPHFRDQVLHVTRTAPEEVELFAVNNEAGGHNLVALNKSESREQTISVRLQPSHPGLYDLWQTQESEPFAAPRRMLHNVPFASSLELTLPKMTATTVVLRSNGGR